MILVVDNYDSFTFNLVQALQAAGADVRVVRNDAIDRAGVEALADDPDADLRGIVISPGPGDPDDAGVSVETVRVAVDREIPLLGVCLGMQSMAAAFGADIVRAPTLVHGMSSEVTHDGAGLLEGMPPAFQAARYHSLAVDPATLPPPERSKQMKGILPAPCTAMPQAARSVCRSGESAARAARGFANRPNTVGATTSPAPEISPRERKSRRVTGGP